MTNLKPTFLLLLDEAESLSVSDVMLDANIANEVDTFQLSELLSKNQFDHAVANFTEEQLNQAQDIIDLVLNTLKS